MNVSRKLHEEGQGSTGDLEKDDASLLVWVDRRLHVENHGMDPWHKTKCGTDDIEIRPCLEKYGVVAKYKSQEHDG